VAEAEADIAGRDEGSLPSGPGEKLSPAGVLLALGLLVLSLFWMLQAGIISHGAQVAEAVPAVPAVGGLLVLSLVGLALRRFSRRLRLSWGQALYAYCFLCVAVTMNEVGVVRMLFPQATVIYYFASPENNFQQLQKYMPTWLAPNSPSVVQDMYEGAGNEKVPWRAWMVPLAAWTLFLTAFFVAMQGVTALFRRQWADKERLTFPIVELALDVADQEGQRVVGGFFRNPLMWAGFGIAALYNVSNILNAWNPAVPAIGRAYDLGRLFTERPLSAINPLSIAWRPENIGLGYLVPSEVTLSVWVFYLAQRLANVVVTGFGYETSGFPYDREQSSGSYLVLGLFLIWVARDHLKAAWHSAWGRVKVLDDRLEPMSYRAAFLAAGGGFAVMCLVAMKAGMWGWTALIYFGLVLLFALVYARARAEAGAAMIWLFPFYLHKQMMIHVAGSAPFARGGNWSNLTMLSTFSFVSRGFFQSQMAYQMESSKIAQEARLRQRAMTCWLIAGAVIGLVGAYIVHLHAYYTLGGANILEGGTTEGGYRVMLAKQEFEELSGFVTAHRPPDLPRTWAAVFGGIFTLALIGIRTVSLRFPFHPLGFAMVTSYGDPLWGPFLLVWIVKSLVLRVGGMRAYRRGIPFFLGIVLGHFFVAGLVWGWLSIRNDMYLRYSVHFG
jgi:hypothetical protein